MMSNAVVNKLSLNTLTTTIQLLRQGIRVTMGEHAHEMILSTSTGCANVFTDKQTRSILVSGPSPSTFPLFWPEMGASNLANVVAQLHELWAVDSFNCFLQRPLLLMETRTRQP